ncbi:MAG: hypothetical protein ABSF90_02990 [Syntrophobacteraceae bacterium]|jgi:hypothetical protein
MRYWVTTHYPPFVGEKEHPDVYLRAIHKEVGEALSIGDCVIVYECGQGKAVKNKKRLRGRQGVVYYGSVSKTLHEDSEAKPEDYTDGTSTLWNWSAPIRVLSRSGFLSRSELAVCLGYEPTYVFHGFGTKHSGLMVIKPEQYENIVGKFHAGK